MEVNFVSYFECARRFSCLSSGRVGIKDSERDILILSRSLVSL